jgi:hypothetical protein
VTGWNKLGAAAAIIDEDDVSTIAGKIYRGGQTGGAAADDQTVNIGLGHHTDRPYFQFRERAPLAGEESPIELCHGSL